MALARVAIHADDPAVLLFMFCPLFLFFLLCIAGWWYRRRP